MLSKTGEGSRFGEQTCLSYHPGISSREQLDYMTPLRVVCVQFVWEPYQLTA